MKMRNFLIVCLGLFGLTSFAFAQSSNNANEFAMQAGGIAGAAQACGQDVSTLSSRTVEVINLLTKVPAEQQQAMTVYEKVLATSQINQSRNHTIPCSKVIDAYNSLPLLKSDYKQTVLPSIAKMGNS